MPPDRHCICGGAGWDGCEPQADPGLIVRSDLPAIRTALATDAGRPLGLSGLLVVDQTAATLAELAQGADAPPALSLGSPNALTADIQLTPTHNREVTRARLLA